jgi:hypothetical protein
MRLPAEARAVLSAGVLCHVAARTSNGPHLTPVVFVLDGGRLWLTTARRSVKARAWRGDPVAAGLVVGGDRALLFRGRVRTYDVLDPVSWPATAVTWPWLTRAAARFSVKNARFFAGYAVDARRVPLAWTPPGRVFAGVELLAVIVADMSSGKVVETWGDWAGAVSSPGRAVRTVESSSDRRRALDLGVPRDVRERVGSNGQAALAVDGPAGLAVLPAAFERLSGSKGYHANVSPRLASLSGLRTNSHAFNAALTVDHASAWRAAEMTGLMVQGAAVTEEGDDGNIGVRIDPRRVVWWEGWRSGTVRARSSRAAAGVRGRVAER